MLQWLQLCVHGVSSLRGSEGAPVLEGYLLSSRGAQLCHLLCTHAVALHLGHDEAAVAKYRLIEGSHELRPAISLDTRNYIKQALPKQVRPSIFIDCTRHNTHRRRAVSPSIGLCLNSIYTSISLCVL